jgi:MFS family permease
MIGLYFALNLKTDSSSLMMKLSHIDYIGILVFSGASCALLIGITTGGTLYSWSSAPVLVPLLLGLALYMAFILYEWKTATDPMIPLRVFNDRTAASAFFSAFIHGVVLWCFAYYLIIFVSLSRPSPDPSLLPHIYQLTHNTQFLGALQQGRFRSALETLPGSAYSAPAAVLAGILAKRYLRFRALLWTGFLLLTVGLATTVTMHPDSSPGVLYGPRVIASIGAGFLFPVPQLAAQVTQRGDDVGVATSLIVFFRSLGQAFGVAVGGVIFQNLWDVEVARRIGDGSIPVGYRVRSEEAEVAYRVIAGFPEEVQESYRWVYSDSLRMVWIIMTAVAAVGFVVSLVARNESLDKGAESRQGFREGRRGEEVGEEVKP